MNLEGRTKVSKDDVLAAIGDKPKSSEKDQFDQEVAQFEQMLSQVRNGKDPANIE